MPIVNYVREHIRFMEYASDEHLTAGERLLWYALMHVMNQRAQGNVWPEGFIRISNDRLLTYFPMRYDTLTTARNGLKQHGLIDFTKGDKNKLAPAYKMIYFCPEYVASDSEQNYPEIPDKNEGYPEISDNIGGNSRGNIGGNSRDYNINIYGERIPLRNPDRNPVAPEDEDDDDDVLRARVREEIMESWRRGFGREPNPAQVSDLTRRAAMYGFGEGVLDEAITLAALKAPGSPHDYLVTLLDDWHRNHCATREDVQEYGYLWDATRGKLRDSIHASGAEDALRAFNQARETDDERQAREAWETRTRADLEARRGQIAARSEEAGV